MNVEHCSVAEELQHYAAGPRWLPEPLRRFFGEVGIQMTFVPVYVEPPTEDITYLAEHSGTPEILSELLRNRGVTTFDMVLAAQQAENCRACPETTCALGALLLAEARSQ